VFAGSSYSKNPLLMKQALEEISSLSSSFDLRPLISKVFPFNSFKDAILLMHQRKLIGKVVLMCQNNSNL
jgi:NADPH:quinone reductase-like Zn-dependent oxidoreductase